MPLLSFRLEAIEAAHDYLIQGLVGAYICLGYIIGFLTSSDISSRRLSSLVSKQFASWLGMFNRCGFYRGVMTHFLDRLSDGGHFMQFTLMIEYFSHVVYSFCITGAQLSFSIWLLTRLPGKACIYSDIPNRVLFYLQHVLFRNSPNFIQRPSTYLQCCLDFTSYSSSLRFTLY
jgi:hypothetical protein